MTRSTPPHARPQGDRAVLTETHTSILVAVGDRVYKLKKAVDLGFLDFRRREDRRRACNAEVSLNRRLSPDVYLGVADVVAPDGAPCDHLVVMRRMPAGRRLTTLVHAGVRLEPEIRRLARLIAKFHAAADRSPDIDAAGTPERIGELWHSNLAEMERFTGGLLDGDVHHHIAVLAQRYLAGRAPLLEARRARGLVVDGHGDLLADDIYLLDDGPRVLDCVEFDDRLRHGDVLADVAFLAMDLERLGAPALANRFVAEYMRFSGEHHPSSYLHHHIAYRALVRSKVACLRAEQGDVDAAEQASQLHQLALRHLLTGRVPLVLVGGPPGTGKSTLGAAIAEALNLTVLRSDEVRRGIAGIGDPDRHTARFGGGIYTAETSAATYTEMLERARVLLGHGIGVVIDASWSDVAWRERAREVAGATVSDLTELRCTCPPRAADARIRARAMRGRDPSEATPAIAAHMRSAFPVWPEATTLDTQAGGAALLVRALEAVGLSRPTQEAGGFVVAA